MELKQILKNFGLTENESDIYLTVLRLGASTASQITEKTNIHRINVYDILERLQEKGLISYSILGKRKQYEVIDPKVLLKLEEERLDEIKKAMPELSSIKNQFTSQGDAVVFKDKKGIKNILDEITSSKTDVKIIASGGGFQKAFPDYFPVWLERLSQNKIKVDVLLSNNYKDLKAPKPTIYKFLPAEFLSPSTTNIYEDKLFINIWQDQPLGILITNKALADSYRNYFNVLWKIAKS